MKIILLAGRFLDRYYEALDNDPVKLIQSYVCVSRRYDIFLYSPAKQLTGRFDFVA
jgi:hypothetical protein